ncbi:hypothetical protein LPW26_00365 [Rhodopseudomonas sp. HC1]|uniref:hypothetical protein n=1 Tax=Rhodopseudomonas infernalis TaxID=2897386 RepID=UPI001EE83A51|nr:hypothetical protein [Rhodopseudomonas infernalis]MCG6203075.1 hypothetical protein [Rhodopseudomonas infernalis]
MGLRCRVQDQRGAMSARSLLAQFVVVLLLTGQGILGAQAARESEAIEPAPAASDVQPETAVGSVASGADVVRLVENGLGARAYDLALSDQGGAPFFEIKSLKDDNIWSTVIEAATKRIVSSAVVMSKAELRGDDKRNIEAFERSRMPLTEAIAIAEKYGAGRAISAGLHVTEGKLVFAVVVVSGGALKEIHVEPDKRPGRRRSPNSRPR